jgi:hypothetical protein
MTGKIALIPLILASLNPAPAEEVFGIEVKNEHTVQLNVPYTHQIHNIDPENFSSIGVTACGPTTLTMALNYVGVDIDLENVIARLPNSVYVKRVGFYRLSEGPKYFDKKSVQVEQTPTGIYEALAGGNPVILNIQNYDGAIGHAVVVTGIKGFNGQTADSLIVHDPFVGPYREFEYINNDLLRQPEGHINYIGTLQPFYVK